MPIRAIRLRNAYVATNGLAESGTAGTDALPPVLPTTANLGGLFPPGTDSPWLSITGITNGVITFSFTANTNAPRTGNIFVYGLDPVSTCVSAFPLEQTFNSQLEPPG